MFRPIETPWYSLNILKIPLELSKFEILMCIHVFKIRNLIYEFVHEKGKILPCH